MVTSIASLPSLVGNPSKLLGSPDVGTNDGSFATMVYNTINSLQQGLRTSEVISSGSLIKTSDITDVVTAVSEAELALQSLIAIRDKAIAAYMDILKMPV